MKNGYGLISIRAFVTGILSVGMLSVAACGSGVVAPTTTPTSTLIPSEPTAELSEADQRATQVMFELYVDPYENANGGVQIPALRDALDLRHPGLTVPLVELTRFAVEEDQVAELGATLSELTGASYPGDDFFSWYEWLGDQPDVQTLPRYPEWKTSLYAIFDNSFHRFIYNGVPASIPLHGIQWGGVRRDGIPPLEDPRVIPGNEVAYLEPDEFVFGVVINGEARAYPFRIMNSHEMANDVLGGTNITLAYCTLCGSGIVYVGEVNGHPETFGTSGFLNQSNKLMYDRTTNSLWQQQTGEPVVGELADSGIRLKQLPVTVTRWEEWLRDHPETTALDIQQGFNRRYHHPDDAAAIYFEYFHGDDLLFPVWDQDTTLNAKTRVLGIRSGENARAYIVEQAIEARVINDELAGMSLVIVADADSSSVRAYRRGEFTFSPGEFSDEVVDQHGDVWTVTEDTLIPRDGDAETLPRQVAQDVFWFGWTTFFPETALWLPAVPGAGDVS